MQRVGSAYPVVYAHVQDRCYETVQFLSGGRARWVPQGIGIGVNSGLEAAGATVTFYRTTYRNKKYSRDANSFFTMTVTPRQSITTGGGKFQTALATPRGTNATMSGVFSSQATEAWAPNPSGNGHVNTYYCRPAAGTSGRYYLDNSYEPQSKPVWSAVWPTESTAYSIPVSASTTFSQLPDASLLSEGRSAVAQGAGADYLGFAYDTGVIGSATGSTTIGTEVIEFGSENTILPEPWNMGNSVPCT
jgi:hypothetical protein